MLITKNLFGVWNLELGTCNPTSGVWNLEFGAWNLI
jgi:hypothetical protein